MKIIPPLKEKGEKEPLPFLKREIIYAPFYLFEVEYTGGKKLYFGVDAVKGKTSTIENQIIDIAEDFKGSPGIRKIEREKAEEIAMLEARFPVGIFFKKRLEKLRYLDLLLYPFIVYYKKGKKGYDIDVYDAITGKKENLFAKEIIVEILLSG
ncbi:MAG: hypothetical protein J7L62_05505 [Candidatus Aminicenantes bacterium]|nr:hypothetical protein [Candidatus Aminicenantes bacterium]